MRRVGYTFATSAAVIGVAVASLVHLPTKLIWNASASIPIGLYSITPAHRLGVANLVAVRPSERLAGFLAERHYLPLGVPLMKRIAAMPGQQVCRLHDVVTVDGVAMATALDRDRRGRPLPAWQGCTRIADDQIFLMNWSVRDSFDGRYFGPLSSSAIIGQALPVWTDEQGNGRYVWRAATH
jgi:conjugative transfer signal peptidase TraF